MRHAVLLLAACGSAPTAPPVAVDDYVVTSSVGGGGSLTLTVTVTAPRDATWTLSEPDLGKLDRVSPTERVEQVAQHTITRRTWTVQGPPGHHEIGPFCVVVEGAGQPACSSSVWLDIGVTPERTDMADIVEPSATLPPLPWAWIGGGVVGLAALAGLGWWWRQRPPRVVLAEVAAEPPHAAAIRRWEAIRDDPALSDFDKAVGMSEVFRAYVEATLGIPARAWTTTQTLTHLQGLDALPKMNVPRARRLLKATDRVKYAEAEPGSSFFEELESDLHAFVDATRPRAWDEAGRPAEDA